MWDWIQRLPSPSRPAVIFGDFKGTENDYEPPKGHTAIPHWNPTPTYHNNDDPYLEGEEADFKTNPIHGNQTSHVLRLLEKSLYGNIRGDLPTLDGYLNSNIFMNWLDTAEVFKDKGITSIKRV